MTDNSKRMRDFFSTPIQHSKEYCDWWDYWNDPRHEEIRRLKNLPAETAEGELGRSVRIKELNGELAEKEREVVAKQGLDKPEKADTGRRQKQVALIASLIESSGNDPMSLPDGTKKLLCKMLCEKHPLLFTPSGFNRAWNKGLDEGLWRMKNHNLYSPRK